MVSFRYSSFARSDRWVRSGQPTHGDRQRMFFQCNVTENPHDWSDDPIWSELPTRLAGSDVFTLREGPVLERTVLPFRSFLHAAMRHANLLLAGDAGHTVPPTGAKGLNLALAEGYSGWPTR